MKWILKKDLPLAKAWTEVEVKYHSCTSSIIVSKEWKGLAYVTDSTISEWLEEIKEPKTIYDLKEGDEYFLLSDWLKIVKDRVDGFSEYHKYNSFTTEREAKRHKILRELATRTDKWLPEKGEIITDILWRQIDWRNDRADSIAYNLWFVFRNEEEYNKYMTPETQNLLFKL
jgi:hypothetical protein